ncbi:hypothetical protein FHR83_006768 [Actinoplanes campanulatus]|uniref:Uncharacterized protein n=1 Tax=Actinoplanes campanulatus TaxID=113559 RepID=A0A7W5AMK3_9ACTN|nr:hypothetical protein [Actinoplanes campanulatus]MBB3099062.1 hypothetical protein [Actinoplanes campanulatus]
MNEPDNLTGWVDRLGGTWVRVDDCPAPSYAIFAGSSWYPRTDGPGFDPQVHDGIGQPRSWDQVEYDFAPLTPASPELTAETIALVRRAVSE